MDIKAVLQKDVGCSWLGGGKPGGPRSAEVWSPCGWGQRETCRRGAEWRGAGASEGLL